MRDLVKPSGCPLLGTMGIYIIMFDQHQPLEHWFRLQYCRTRQYLQILPFVFAEQSSLSVFYWYSYDQSLKHKICLKLWNTDTRWDISFAILIDFQSVDVVCRGSETQLQLTENSNWTAQSSLYRGCRVSVRTTGPQLNQWCATMCKAGNPDVTISIIFSVVVRYRCLDDTRGLIIYHFIQTTPRLTRYSWISHQIRIIRRRCGIPRTLCTPS